MFEFVLPLGRPTSFCTADTDSHACPLTPNGRSEGKMKAVNEVATPQRDRSTCLVRSMFRELECAVLLVALSACPATRMLAQAQQKIHPGVDRALRTDAALARKRPGFASAGAIHARTPPSSDVTALRCVLALGERIFAKSAEIEAKRREHLAVIYQGRARQLNWKILESSLKGVDAAKLAENFDFVAGRRNPFAKLAADQVYDILMDVSNAGARSVLDGLLRCTNMSLDDPGAVAFFRANARLVKGEIQRSEVRELIDAFMAAPKSREAIDAVLLARHVPLLGEPSLSRAFARATLASLNDEDAVSLSLEDFLIANGPSRLAKQAKEIVERCERFDIAGVEDGLLDVIAFDISERFAALLLADIYASEGSPRFDRGLALSCYEYALTDAAHLVTSEDRPLSKLYASFEDGATDEQGESGEEGDANLGTEDGEDDAVTDDAAVAEDATVDEDAKLLDDSPIAEGARSRYEAVLAKAPIFIYSPTPVLEKMFKEVASLPSQRERLLKEIDEKQSEIKSLEKVRIDPRVYGGSASASINQLKGEIQKRRKLIEKIDADHPNLSASIAAWRAAYQRRLAAETRPVKVIPRVKKKRKSGK